MIATTARCSAIYLYKSFIYRLLTQEREFQKLKLIPLLLCMLLGLTAQANSTNFKILDIIDRTGEINVERYAS